MHLNGFRNRSRGCLVSFDWFRKDNRLTYIVLVILRRKESSGMSWDGSALALCEALDKETSGQVITGFDWFLHCIVGCLRVI